MSFPPSLVAIGLIVLLASAGAAHAEYDTCLAQYAQSGATGYGFAPSDVDEIVGEIATGISLPSDNIAAVPCPDVFKVEANYLTNQKDEAQDGEYIFYNPEWVREVLGPTLSGDNNSPQRAEAIVLFGHELGHLLGRHFTANKNKMTRLQKETAADQFAGCAAGYMGVSWDRVQDLLSRIRNDFESTYPDRATSLKVAKEGYDRCARGGAGPEGRTHKQIIADLNKLQDADLSGLRALASEILVAISDEGATAESVLDLIDALAPRMDKIRDFDDATRRSMFDTLGAVRADWWGEVAWSEATRRVRYGLASLDDYLDDPVTPSAATAASLKQLWERVKYSVPPDRVLQIGAFRIAVDYCSSVKCDVEFAIKGYDERGQLRVLEFWHADGISQGEFRDIDSTQRIYFQVEPGSTGKPVVSFKLYCRTPTEPLINGGSVNLNWTRADEVYGDVAVWPSCANNQISARLGLYIHPMTDGRQFEHAVRKDFDGSPWDQPSP